MKLLAKMYLFKPFESHPLYGKFEQLGRSPDGTGWKYLCHSNGRQVIAYPAVIEDVRAGFSLALVRCGSPIGTVLVPHGKNPNIMNLTHGDAIAVADVMFRETPAGTKAYCEYSWPIRVEVPRSSGRVSSPPKDDGMYVFITDDDGGQQVYGHASDIEDGAYTRFVWGMRLTYEKVIGPKGPKAVRIRVIGM